MKFDLSKYVQKWDGCYPADKRGVIKGDVPKRPQTSRKGGDMTNEQYAKEHGISRRQASKQRRGY